MGSPCSAPVLISRLQKLCSTQLIPVLIPSFLPGSEEEEWIEEDDGSYCIFHYFLSLLLGKVVG